MYLATNVCVGSDFPAAKSICQSGTPAHTHLAPRAGMADPCARLPLRVDPGGPCARAVWPLILHLCTACLTDCLDFTSNQPLQPLFLSTSVTTTTNFLDPLTDLAVSKQYDTVVIQTLSDTHVLVRACHRRARLIAHRLRRTYTVVHCGAALGGYGCTHVDCPNTTKAARSQPSHLNIRAMADSTGHVYGPDRPPSTACVVAAALATPMEPSLTRC